MTLYARIGRMCDHHPRAGGCGAQHTDQVTSGAPAKIFKLDCAPARPTSRGDRKPKILKYQIDAKTGQTVRQERVADGDPMWSSTPDTIPLTPDEDRTNSTRQERGRMQIEMIQALAAMRATGIQVPPEAMWLLEREIPEGVLRGTVVCAERPRQRRRGEVLRGMRRVHGRPRCHRPARG